MATQPTPVFLPGESHEQRSLVGFSPWGCSELDMTEATQLACTHTVRGRYSDPCKFPSALMVVSSSPNGKVKKKKSPYKFILKSVYIDFYHVFHHPSEISFFSGWDESQQRFEMILHFLSCQLSTHLCLQVLSLRRSGKPRLSLLHCSFWPQERWSCSRGCGLCTITCHFCGGQATSTEPFA